jgi:hypothetical protein
MPVSACSRGGRIVIPGRISRLIDESRVAWRHTSAGDAPRRLVFSILNTGRP